MSRHFEARGRRLERPDLRVPSLERLRLSEMIAVTRAAIGGDGEKAILFGSSLGGLTAARVAERDPRVHALVLLAPAFRFTETWEKRLGPAAWEAWRKEGLEIQDYANAGRRTRVDFGFMEDARRIESAGLPRVEVPTLIIHGRRDETVDVGVSREWAAGKTHVRLLEVDDTHELKASLPLIKAESDLFLAPYFSDGN